MSSDGVFDFAPPDEFQGLFDCFSYFRRIYGRWTLIWGECVEAVFKTGWGWQHRRLVAARLPLEMLAKWFIQTRLIKATCLGVCHKRNPLQEKQHETPT